MEDDRERERRSKFGSVISWHKSTCKYIAPFFYIKWKHNFFFLNFFNREDANNPSFWSRVCLHNMAKLAKEATTTRRVLESLFRCFDNGKLWPAHHGLAFPVLKDMQFLMDDSGIYLDYYLTLFRLVYLESFNFLRGHACLLKKFKCFHPNYIVYEGYLWECRDLFYFSEGVEFLNSKT